MQSLFQCISSNLPASLNEVRLTINKPVVYKVDNKSFTISEIVSERQLRDLLRILTDNSLYAVGDYISSGFITYKGGIRVGIAGDYTIENSKPKAIKNINGLVIRIPKEVVNCSKCITDKYFDKSILIVSKPYGGKTTFLRDLATRISEHKQVVVLDERKELSGDGKLNLGNCMVLSGVQKSLLYDSVIRSLAPEVIVLDELSGEKDFQTVKSISNSGVQVVASIHSDSLDKLPDVCKLFQVKVLLSAFPSVGSVVDIRYD